jgi:Zn-finger nucleic acid-binding protein
MLVCPRDNTALMPREIVAGSAVWRCPSCSGLWLPAASVPEAAKSVRCPIEGRGVSTLRCPEDSVLLYTVRHRGVELDPCAVCGGIWFDRGELEQLLRLRTQMPVRRGRGNTAIESAGLVVDGATFVGSSLESSGEVVSLVLDFLAGLFSSL